MAADVMARSGPVAPTAQGRTGWLVLGLAVALTSCAASDDPTAVPPDRPSVTATGTGEVTAVPDVEIAALVVDSAAPEVAVAMTQAAARRRTVLDALVSAGVDSADLATAGVDLRPTETGYRAIDTLTLTVRRPDQTPRLLDVAVRASGGAARVESVADGVADTSALVRTARERAYEDALGQARRAAANSGKRLGAMFNGARASDDVDESATADAPPTGAIPGQLTLRPGQRTVRAVVTASWEMV